MEFNEFKKLVVQGFRNCPNYPISFRERKHSFVATILRKDLITQPFLLAAVNLYSTYNFKFYVYNKTDYLNLVIVYEL